MMILLFYLIIVVIYFYFTYNYTFILFLLYLFIYCIYVILLLSLFHGMFLKKCRRMEKKDILKLLVGWIFSFAVMAFIPFITFYNSVFINIFSLVSDHYISFNHQKKTKNTHTITLLQFLHKRPIYTKYKYKCYTK